MKEKFLLKDHLFNESKVRYFAQLLAAAYSPFDEKVFVREVVGKFPELELKARIAWIAEVLGRHLPTDFNEAAKIMVMALLPPLDSTKTDADFGDFIFAPLGEYVVRNGLSKKHLELSLRTLREITTRFSMENAMRAFLNTFPTETLAEYNIWVNDGNYHVRRLVSESTRPSLPWSQKINVDYKLPVKYLNILYKDKTRYVTRSVANHLNDVSKKDPVLVIDTLKRWRNEGGQSESEITWMTKHALRTLIKRGDANALALLGYVHDAEVEVCEFVLVSTECARGDMLKFSCTLSTKTDTNIMLDYIIDFVKANNTTKPRVFKLKKLILKAGETITITKKHHLKSDATTFKLNPGTHALTLQINGKKSTTRSFNVT